ncbi:hypothetical protein OIO90_002950 [Microbotryomycetes sp. JL221]|nr:hypothetical protein OIO90_002950 [Microbotryomycetes sp. JL221]
MCATPRTQGGVVLWSRSFTPSPSPCDALIREALIEQRTTATDMTLTNDVSSDVSNWTKDGYALVWTLANHFELVFVVAYQRILQLGYANELVDVVKRTFLKMYQQTIQTVVDVTKGHQIQAAERVLTTLRQGQAWSSLWQGWDDTFNKILREFETNAAKVKRTPKSRAVTGQDQATASSDVSEAQTPSKQQTENGVLDAQTIAKNIAALKARQKSKGKGKKMGVDATDTGSDTDASRPATPAKKMATKWSDSKVSAADMAAYDYSSDAPSSSGAVTPNKSLVSSSALGKRTKSGLYEVADYASAGNDDEDDEEDEDDATESKSSKPSVLSSLFSKLSLTSKALTKQDLQPALEQMRQHLMSKNVAKDIAEKVCDSVGKTLEGRQVSGYNGIKKEVRKAMEEALVKILTPKTSTDILLDVQRKKASNRSIVSSNKTTNEPYTITFVGVNGVGKSTNLSKVAFWLLQNNLRVLIAACDTFRSGAVEQLRVHVRNLGQLGESLQGGVGLVREDGTNMIELYEKGYGKDAAGIAKEAIAYGKDKEFDVVLIDTAGRMQDNEPLMRALAKLVTVNNPDKIVFVGEALVGNEAVDQLTKFNRSLRDFSGSSNARGIDGMILTKFDTIDDKVGAALSMTYVTGQPILFVGTGQTYSDLRALRVAHIVQALLQD